jgi:transposase-like protein
MGKRGPKPKFIEQACPNKTCKLCGQTRKGNVIGNGTYRTKSGPVRKFKCKDCGTSFCARKNTAFFDLRSNDEKMLLALKMIVKGMSLRATAQVLDVHLDTVRAWLQRAAKHCEQVNLVLIRDLHVSKVELDELWTFVNKKNFRQWTTGRTIARGSGPQ